jgi:hypothetical protein
MLGPATATEAVKVNRALSGRTTETATPTITALLRVKVARLQVLMELPTI